MQQWPVPDPATVRAPAWYRFVMLFGAAVGLAGTIAGAITLVTEGSQATLVGPIGSPILLLICVRLARLRVEVRPDEFLVANLWSTVRVQRDEVSAIERDRGAGSGRRRLRLRLRSGRLVDVGLSGVPENALSLLSEQAVDAMTEAFSCVLALAPAELTAADTASDFALSPWRRNLRPLVGGVCGLWYGVIAAPGGALVIAALAGFIWGFARLFRDALPTTWREVSRRTRIRPAVGAASGRAFMYALVAPAAPPFALAAVVVALARIALGHPVNHQ